MPQTEMLMQSRSRLQMSEFNIIIFKRSPGAGVQSECFLLAANISFNCLAATLTMISHLLHLQSIPCGINKIHIEGNIKLPVICFTFMYQTICSQPACKMFHLFILLTLDNFAVCYSHLMPTFSA